MSELVKRKKSEIRKSMIEDLIEQDMENNTTDSGYVREMLFTGIRGYKDITEEELIQEYEMYVECVDENKDKLEKYMFLSTLIDVIPNKGEQ